MAEHGFMCVLRGPSHVFELTNGAYLKLVGQRDLVGKPVRRLFPKWRDKVLRDAGRRLHDGKIGRR